ncbi:SpoIIIAH-like protein [compost metagenome]
MITSYQDMINSTGTTEAQKEIATKEIEKINNIKNSIMICENLISTKGFKNSVVFVNDNSVSAVIEAEELKPEDLAQIQNILQRELKVELENLHISNKKAN